MNFIQDPDLTGHYILSFEKTVSRGIVKLTLLIILKG